MFLRLSEAGAEIDLNEDTINLKMDRKPKTSRHFNCTISPFSNRYAGAIISLNTIAEGKSTVVETILKIIYACSRAN